MDLNKIALEVVEKIANMKDGERETISRLVRQRLSTEEMFKICEIVTNEASKRGITLDYSSHKDKFEGLPFNLDFVKR